MSRKHKKNVTNAMASFADIPTSSSETLEPIPVAQKSSDSVEPNDDALVVENADLAIRRGGENFYDYYAAYKSIRELAKTMHGKPASAPIPHPVSIKKITIEYTLDGGESKFVYIPEPQKIGDIAPLLSFAVRDIIEKMNNQLHVLSYLVSGMHNAVQTAFNARAMAPPRDMEDNTNTQQ